MFSGRSTDERTKPAQTASASHLHCFLGLDHRLVHRVCRSFFDAAVDLAQLPENQKQQDGHQVQQELDSHLFSPLRPAEIELPGILLPPRRSPINIWLAILTYYVQTAPGATMNTQAGYGNTASFDIFATSNLLRVDGMNENDLFSLTYGQPAWLARFWQPALTEPPLATISWLRHTS